MHKLSCYPEFIAKPTGTPEEERQLEFLVSDLFAKCVGLIGAATEADRQTDRERKKQESREEEKRRREVVIQVVRVPHVANKMFVFAQEALK